MTAASRFHSHIFVRLSQAAAIVNLNSEDGLVGLQTGVSHWTPVAPSREPGWIRPGCRIKRLWSSYRSTAEWCILRCFSTGCERSRKSILVGFCWLVYWRMELI